MTTKPCEVCVTTTDGRDIEQYDCRSLARILVNGMPMCAGHFAEFEAHDLVESVGMLEREAS